VKHFQSAYLEAVNAGQKVSVLH